MRVRPVDGEDLAYFVASRSRPNVEHLVRLDEFDGHGGCGCEDFQFHHQPELERGAKSSPSLQCEHIKQALYEIGRSCVRVVMERKGTYAPDVKKPAVDRGGHAVRPVLDRDGGSGRKTYFLKR